MAKEISISCLLWKKGYKVCFGAFGRNHSNVLVEHFQKLSLISVLLLFCHTRVYQNSAFLK